MQLDTNFKDDLGVDSLDLYEIVMKMEDEFDVEIPAEELEDVATFEDVLNCSSKIAFTLSNILIIPPKYSKCLSHCPADDYNITHGYSKVNKILFRFFPFFLSVSDSI